MRIASLQPSVSLTLAYLGRLHTVCAATRYCLSALPEELATTPILPDSWSFDRSPEALEALLVTRPDLVIASVPYRPESLEAILKSGLPVLALAPHTLADIFNDTRLIAHHVDARAEAEILIQTLQQALAAAAEMTKDLPRKTVYCEEWGKPLIHSQPWIAELIEAAGGTFVGTPGTHTTPETIAEADPDVLLFSWCGAGDRVPLARTITQRNWQNLQATQTQEEGARSFASPTNSSTPPPSTSTPASPPSPPPFTPPSSPQSLTSNVSRTTLLRPLESASSPHAPSQVATTAFIRINRFAAKESQGRWRFSDELEVCPHILLYRGLACPSRSVGFISCSKLLVVSL